MCGVRCLAWQTEGTHFLISFFNIYFRGVRERGGERGERGEGRREERGEEEEGDERRREEGDEWRRGTITKFIGEHEID